ncbi:hypothetical protein D3C86_769880 [compost metagenome]
MTWVIDQRHSYVGFTIKHMMFATVRGTFQEYYGLIDLNQTDLASSSFIGEINVASVDTRVAKRDEHLRSEAFFNVERFPLILYKSTKIETQTENRFRVYGNLTIHGITREIVVDGTYAGGPYKDPDGILRTGFSGSATLSRKDFGMLWNVALESGGVLVDDRVDLQLDIELMWQEDHLVSTGEEATTSASKTAVSTVPR